jgi:hypothetical protein
VWAHRAQSVRTSRSSSTLTRRWWWRTRRRRARPRRGNVAAALSFSLCAMAACHKRVISPVGSAAAVSNNCRVSSGSASNCWRNLCSMRLAPGQAGRIRQPARAGWARDPGRSRPRRRRCDRASDVGRSTRAARSATAAWKPATEARISSSVP